METPEFYFKGGAAAAAGGGGGGGGGYQYSNSPFNSEKSRFNGDHFIVDELLDYPNDDGMIVGGSGGGGDEIVTDVAAFDTTTFSAAAAGTSTDSSSITGGGVDNSSFMSKNTSSSLFAVQGDNSCRSYTDGQFSTELCVPYDDMAELEWLSNCVEESFSIEDMHKLQLISGMKAQTNDIPQYQQVKPEPNRDSSTTTTTTTIFRPEIAVPAKARSKRSRAYPCNWTTRLLAASSGATPPPTTTTPSSTMSSSSESNVNDRTKMSQKKKEVMYENDSEGRKCFHCATDKTPQWRTGPMGPKTLCNACGVRYKSGRLVPEYRPAASPTFVLTKHSNSHRKVVELRRQNEFIRNQQHQHQHQHQQLLHQNMMFDASNGGDFLIHHHLGTDFRQLI